MTISSGDVLRVAVQLALPDNVVGNLIFHYLATAGTGGDEDTILTSLAGNVETALDAVKTSITTAASTTAALMWKWNTTLHQWDGVSSMALSGFAGTAATDYLPNQNAAQIDFYTSTPRRQGRKYIPGLVETAVSYGDIAAGTIALLITCAAYLDNQIVSSGIDLDPGVWNTTPASAYYETFEIFTGSTAVETYCSSQRRRKPGVGI